MLSITSTGVSGKTNVYGKTFSKQPLSSLLKASQPFGVASSSPPDRFDHSLRFGSSSDVKLDPTMHNMLVSANNSHIEATAVRIGDFIENVGIKVLPPMSISPWFNWEVDTPQQEILNHFTKRSGLSVTF